MSDSSASVAEAQTVATLTDIGPREVQQDRAVAHAHDDGSWVVAVFDGLGGHVRGEDAAQAACDAMPQRIDGQDEMDAAMVAANDAVWNLIPNRHFSIRGPDRDDPLTTVAAAAWTPQSGLVTAWIGDSVPFFVPVAAGVPGLHGEPQGHWDSPMMDNALGWSPSSYLRPAATMSEDDIETLNGHIDGRGLLVIVATDGMFDPLRHARFGRGGRFHENAADNSLGFAIPPDARTSAAATARALMDAAVKEGLHDNAAVAVAAARRRTGT